MIELQVTWNDPPDGHGEGAALAWGRGMLLVDGKPVWFGEGASPTPLEWSWIELLEFLASKWVYLTTEQAYPMGLAPAEPRELRAALRAQPLYTESDRDRYDEEVFRFEDRHDLARALRGMTVPSVFILREGNDAWVTTDDTAGRFPLAAVVRDLEALGDSIAARVSSSKFSRRAQDAVKVWAQRHTVKTGLLIRLATGFSAGEFRKGLPDHDLQFWELEGRVGADSEIASAARMMQGSYGTAEDRFTIINAIRQLPKVDTPYLDALSARLVREIGTDQKPYEEAYHLADLVRSEFRIEGKAYPERLLEHFGVTIKEVVLSPSVDAVGCWGPKHGPAVFINKQGPHTKSPEARRATLGHELCHLLVDRGRSLPLAEVLGGRSPERAEQRAKAFAAELLLPRWAARTSFQKHRDVHRTLDEVKAEYGVSRGLAAAQLKNSNSGINSAGLTAADLKILDRIIDKDESP